MSIINVGAAANDGTGDQLRNAMRKVNAFHAVISRTASVPGSPANGDLYIVPSGSTGAWASQDNKLAWYNGTTWEFYTATEGFRVWVNDQDLVVVYTGSAWEEQKRAYDIRLGFTATPGAGVVIDTLVLPREVILPANMAGSVGAIDVNPTASFAIDVQDDGVSIGTITISTAGAFTFTTTSGTAKTIASGSVVTFIAPRPADATAEGASITLAARA